MALNTTSSLNEKINEVKKNIHPFIHEQIPQQF